MKHIILYSPHEAPLLMSSPTGELPGPQEDIAYIKLNDEYAFSVTQDRGYHLSGFKFNSFLFLRLKDELARAVFHAIGSLYSYFPTFHPEVNEKFSFAIKAPAEEMTFYGGSFNPWHSGHESCVDLYSDKSKLVIIPDNNPQKAQVTGKLWENYKKILYLQKATPEITLFPGFWRSSEANPTSDWLLNIEGKKNLLMGYDSFIGLETWKNFEKLIQAVEKIFVIGRQDDESLFTEKSNLLQSVNSKIKIIHLGGHAFEGISSTQMR
jgi:nicotinate-nucleotide adenylyltransferase